MGKFFLLILLSAVVFAAGNNDGVSLDTPDGPQPVQSPAPIFSSSDNGDFGEVFTSPVMYTSVRPSEGPSDWPDFDWSNDVLVSSGVVGSGQDWDTDEDTGDLYAIYDTDHDGTTTNDSASVYRSQDGGVTWSHWRTSYSSSSEMSDPQIRVVKDASSQTWVCMYFLIGEQLRMRRMTPDQSSSAWETVADNVIDYDVAGEVGNGGWAYVTYVPSGTTDVYFARNALAGAGWQDNASLFVNAQVAPYPTVAAGTGGTVSVSFSDTRLTTNTEIRIKNSSTYGLNWAGSAQVSNNSGAADLTGNDMAYSHSGTETGWIFTTFEFAAGDNLGYYYSQDGGSSWTYGATMPSTGDENMPSIRARKATGSLTLAYNADPGDSTMFTWASSSTPTNFTAPVRVNDYAATGYWAPAAGWNGSSSGVLYTSFSQAYKLFFDWFGNTPVEEEDFGAVSTASGISVSPNPITDFATISFSTATPGNVTLSVYDSAGRLIDTLLSSEFLSSGTHSVSWATNDNLNPGVYFCVMNADGQTQNHRMVLIK